MTHSLLWRYAIKCILLISMTLAMILPINTYAMSPPYRPPEAMGNTPISIPFPVSDAPVGISAADIHILWGEIGSKYGALYYPAEFSADYTIRYLGEESVMIEVAVPMLGIYSPEPHIRVDGEPADLTAYVPFNRIEYTESENPVSYGIPSFAEYMSEIRAQKEPYIPRHFDADKPAKLYTITQEGPEFSPNDSLDLTLSYDPEKTTLLLNAPWPLEFQPKSDKNDWIKDEAGNFVDLLYLYGEICSNQYQRPDPFEVLVIGEDTLKWDLEYYYDTGKTMESSLKVQTNKTETPREFIMRTQTFKQHFANVFPTPIKTEDFLMRRVDGLFDDHSELAGAIPHSFANVRDLDNIASSDYTYSEQSVSVNIPFDPGEVRVLNVSYSIDAGMRWNKERQQSLFYCTILTEPAKYWDYFESLSVTTNHINGSKESVFSGGFETAGNSSVLNLQNPTGDNIYMGFWLPDEREEPKANWGMAFFFLGLAAWHFWPVTLSIIIVIALIIRHNMRKRKTKKR